MLNMTQILTNLAMRRPIFHSEADFQHALAWEIHQQWPECLIRLERKFSGSSDRNIYLDIWALHSNTTIAIELKYKTKAFNVNLLGEEFNLSNHGAQDLGRYDFLKDIQRLEQIVYKQPRTIGYAILLSNDNTYWASASNQSTADAQFRIHQNRSLTGTLNWGVNASKGTTKGRESPIDIRGLYTVNWQTYSSLNGLPQTNENFKYLLFEISNP